jgi:hypothetical protein
LLQITGTSSISKTGLSFSISDTAKISLSLSVSGQIIDNFLVDQYRVNKYNDKKTSFERVGDIPTRVQNDRITNAQSGYTINPGIYFVTGAIISNVSLSPTQS